MPKSAGGSVKEVLTCCDAKLLKKDTDCDETNNSLSQGSLEKLLFSRLNEGDGFFSIYHAIKNYTVFTFVRNPYARILSGYKEKILKTYEMLGRIESVSKLAPIERRKIKRRKFRLKELGFAKDSPPSFERFIDAVTDVPYREADQHFAPQAYLGAFNLIPYDFIGRVESYDEDMEKLLTLLHKGQFTMEDIKRNSSGPRNYSGALDNQYHHHLTTSSITKINSYYDCDFKAFGYSRDINKIKQKPEPIIPTRTIVSPSFFQLQFLGVQSKSRFALRKVKCAVRDMI
jgi:hypothetical protein